MSIRFNQTVTDNFIFYISLFVSILILCPLITLFFGNFGTSSNYLNFFSNNELLTYIKNSFLILISVLFATFFLGVLSAYLVSFYEFTGVNFFKYSLLLSFAIPPYIYGYTLSAFFENFGTGYSLISNISEDLPDKILPNIKPLTGSIISLSLTLFGYVFILTRSSFLNQSKNLIEVGNLL